jgi:hypothetical protein
MGKDFSWTFWCLNPNSGDTGGLLKYDWTSVEQWKLDKLKPYLAEPIGTPEIGIRPIRPGARGIPASADRAVDAKGRSRTVAGAEVPVFHRP